MIERFSHDDVALLVQNVKAAFADVPYPGDENITSTTFPWDEGVSEYFKGTSQEGHVVKDLRHQVAALSFFLPEAHHYYLPTFVIAVLQDPEEADTIYDSIISDFNHGKAVDIVRRLSLRQRQVMIKYFEYCLNEYGEYLDGYISHAIWLLKDDA